MQIKILSEQLASQIAAGEVVERPASVVKELIENALDAGATTVNVDIRNGGRELVQVADNGSGISPDEVETAFMRHATSKLEQASDLKAIRTLGFRGEALAAIAAVSQLTMVTRVAGETAGVRLILEGGEKRRRDTVGAPQGTVIAVENLFFNVPARRKFLKSVTTERRLIDEFVTRYALAYPHVRFRLSHDGRITFQSTGSDNLLDVLVAVYGAEIARELLEIESRHPAQRTSHDSATKEQEGAPQFDVHGYVGPPSVHRSNRNQITLFVNGRWIKDNRLTYAVIQAYHTLLPTGRYPIAVVFLSLPYAQVDVNVHPAKTEVRFRDANAAFGLVQKAVRRTVTAGAPVRNVGLGAAQVLPSSRTPVEWGGSFDDHAFGQREREEAQGNLDLTWRRQVTVDPSALESSGSSQSANLGGDRLPIMRVVGQVGASYIIAEGPDGLYLIDQHAAHERILYEQFMEARAQERIASQGLVTSSTVQLPPDQATLLAEQIPLLRDLGFQVEPFGPNTFVVRAVPALLSRLDPVVALTAVVEDLEDEKAPLEDKIEGKIVLRVCKTAAVKAGQSLSRAEMEAMIQQLEACQNPHTCPHGRPTLIHLSAAQLARQFGRT
jgi:DNA mismatch repair protein MutL